MEKKNNLHEIPLANITDKELKQIKDLEQQMGDRHYLMALEKNNYI